MVQGQQGEGARAGRGELTLVSWPYLETHFPEFMWLPDFQTHLREGRGRVKRSPYGLQEVNTFKYILLWDEQVRE